MTVKQISVFTESKPGRLMRILRVFDEADVNVRGYSLSDTGDYGIARFIVDKPEEATQALTRVGAASTVKDVICLKLQDTPGALARIMELLADLDENITYSYSMISTYIVLCTPDPEATAAKLHARGIDTVNQEELSTL
jgi:hypothetical protein